MKKMSKSKRRKAGFTLIEILLVVVIIGILAAIVAPKLVSRAGDAKISAAQAQIKNFDTMLETYRLDNDHYPSTEQGLMALIEKPSGSPEPKKWRKSMKSSEVPMDPWGNEYMYEVEEDEYRLSSPGPDGQSDTDDDIKGQ